MNRPCSAHSLSLSLPCAPPRAVFAIRVIVFFVRTFSANINAHTTSWRFTRALKLQSRTLWRTTGGGARKSSDVVMLWASRRFCPRSHLMWGFIEGADLRVNTTTMQVRLAGKWWGGRFLCTYMWKLRVTTQWRDIEKQLRYHLMIGLLNTRDLAAAEFM